MCEKSVRTFIFLAARSVGKTNAAMLQLALSSDTPAKEQIPKERIPEEFKRKKTIVGVRNVDRTPVVRFAKV